jgi:(+)-trans-carveol dehydrogenase
MRQGRLADRVVLVSGAARGQGRAHAVRLASEGADVIAFDVPAPTPWVKYPLGTAEDLAETVRLVEAEGRRIVAGAADVRDMDSVQAVVDAGVDALGPVHVVVANAAIASGGASFWKLTEEEWTNVVDVNLNGVWRTVKAAMPSMLAAGRGGSIVITSSSAALKGASGICDYTAAKMGLVGMARSMARELAKMEIRVNVVFPGNVNSPLIHNDALYRQFRPELEHPTSADVEPLLRRTMLLPHPWAEVDDIANAVAFLASDEARYITGAELNVDLGGALK